MPWQFPDVRTVAGMIRTGLQRLANWLFGRLGSEESRIQFLTGRYPNASLPVLRRGLQQVRNAVEVGSEFQLGPSHPDLSSLPVDPTHAGRGQYAYQVNIVGRGYLEGEGIGRPPNIIERFHIFYSDNPMSRQSLTDAVKQFLTEQLSGPNDYGFAGTPDARLTSFDATVLSITRSE